ncbi:MAG: 2-hydroxychromene-2-carboxylate isomerase [Herminiimonas sp.]|nr:2-hydroxychromene-2-carboxylate isomerase [Herminiimonas sp.]
MPKICAYYFAPQSPYAYLGHAHFVALAKQYGAQVELRPCDIGKIFSLSGGLPLAKRAPQRQAYRMIELQRWQQFRGLPMQMQPKFFPVSGDAASRLIIAAKLAHGTDAALVLTGAIMAAVWAEDRNIADSDTLIALANAQDLDGASLMKSADMPGVQAEYDGYTDAAIAANVFGAPWYVVDGEGFWGQDRLDFVERALTK